MKLKNENIPGLRQPTEQEKAWIWRFWETEANKMQMPNAGKFTKYLAIFLAAFAGASLIRGAEGIKEFLLFLAIAAVVMWFSLTFKKAAQTVQITYDSMKNGTYMVVPFCSQGIGSGRYKGSRRTGYAVVYLNNKEEHIRIPYLYAYKLIQENNGNVPLLLIVIPGDPVVYAAPALESRASETAMSAQR